MMFDDMHEDVPPPEMQHQSSISDITTYVMRCACCMLVFVLVLWIVVFSLACMLLSKANVPSVHSECAGFWDFMLISLLSPVLIPIAYCMLYCITTSMKWHLFSGACMLVFAISSLYMTLAAASNHACTEALRETAPPIPWLILLGWFKAAAYGAGALSSLWSFNVERAP